MPRRDARTVYSTEPGRVCPRCGWPEPSCRCSSNLDQPVPERLAATLRIERKGRRGKTVTIVDGLPRNTAFLEQLASEMKKACGTGGSAGDGRIELQGDRREELRRLLRERGITVKG